MSEQAHINVHFSQPLAYRLDEYFTELGMGINASALVRERRDILYWLNSKSDADLALMGLARREIPQFVFKDLFGSA